MRHDARRLEFNYTCRYCSKHGLAWGLHYGTFRLHESPTRLHVCSAFQKEARCHCEGFADFVIPLRFY